MRQGRPAPVAQRASRKDRPPLDRTNMGFGKHAYEYIDPEASPTDFGPPDGVMRRDFNNAFNRPHEETDVDIDVISRPGTLISTTMPGMEGEWFVKRMPSFINGVVTAHLARSMEEPTILVSAFDLGVVADRFTNLYNTEVITKIISGGRANKATRAELTTK